MQPTHVMKLKQLNLDGTPIPTVFDEESDPRGQHLHGRPPGAKGIVTDHRMVEAARMTVLGDSLPEIAKQLSVGRTRAGQIVKEAEDAGIVDELSLARSTQVKEMSERRYKQARAAMDIVQVRLDRIKEDIDAGGTGDGKESIDARAVNDAFRAMDRTEYTVDGEVKMRDSGGGGKAPIHIDKLAIFTPAAIKEAQQDSDRVYGADT